MKFEVYERINESMGSNPLSMLWLGKALHRADSKKRYFLMLKAHMDESGDSKDPACDFVGMGGLIASEDEWESFNKEWKAVLDEFIGGCEFHMKEFVMVPGIGPYQGWNETKRKLFMSRLVAAILNNHLRFVGAVVSKRDFRELLKEHRDMFLDPYYMVFQTTTRGMAITAQVEATMNKHEEPVALIYALQKKFGATEAGRAQQLWLEMQKNTDFGKWMGIYSAGDPERIYGLQAADLFAYEMTQEFEHFFQIPQKHGMRWPMKQFVKSMDRHIMIKFFSLPTILQTLVENGHLSGSEEEKSNLKLESDLLHLNMRETLYRRARE